MRMMEIMMDSELNWAASRTSPSINPVKIVADPGIGANKIRTNVCLISIGKKGIKKTSAANIKAVPYLKNANFISLLRYC